MKLTLAKNVNMITTPIIVWVATTTRVTLMILKHSVTTETILMVVVAVATVYGISMNKIYKQVTIIYTNWRKTLVSFQLSMQVIFLHTNFQTDFKNKGGIFK